MESSDELDKKIDTFLESTVVGPTEEFTKKTVFKAKYEPISFQKEQTSPWKLVVGVLLVTAAVTAGLVYFLVLS